jgi:hypothetical protein
MTCRLWTTALRWRSNRFFCSPRLRARSPLPLTRGCQCVLDLQPLAEADAPGGRVVTREEFGQHRLALDQGPMRPLWVQVDSLALPGRSSLSVSLNFISCRRVPLPLPKRTPENPVPQPGRSAKRRPSWLTRSARTAGRKTGTCTVQEVLRARPSELVPHYIRAAPKGRPRQEWCMSGRYLTVPRGGGVSVGVSAPVRRAWQGHLQSHSGAVGNGGPGHHRRCGVAHRGRPGTRAAREQQRQTPTPPDA